MAEVGILILDDDKATRAALHQMLDSEGWRVQVLSSANKAMAELASGAWRLVIANVMMTGVDSVLFHMLQDLNQSPVGAGGAAPLRVLFLVPEQAGGKVQQTLEKARLPYALKPFHLHDFLDKISDLLIETGAIPAPIRRVRYDSRAATKPVADSRRSRRSGPGGRQTSMFADRGEYMMSEEEIAEFERQEETERKKKQKKQDRLGDL